MRRASAALLALAALGACADARPPGVVEIGAPAPAFAAKALGADSISLADLEGKVVLLNVWATWCAPCREEIPALQRLHESYAARGLEVVGVSIDAAGEEASIRDFLDDYGVSYPIWHDPSDRVSSTFRLMGVPTTFLIGRDGTLLWRHLGPVKSDDPALTGLLEEAL